VLQRRETCFAVAETRHAPFVFVFPLQLLHSMDDPRGVDTNKSVA
jgi:hypothetical protein